MNADPKRKSRRAVMIVVSRARQHQEEALDDALKNTFPASDPVSIEQPTSSAVERDKERLVSVDNPYRQRLIGFG